MQSSYQRILWPFSLALSGGVVVYSASVNVYTCPRKNIGNMNDYTYDSMFQGTGNFFNPDMKGKRYEHYDSEDFGSFLSGGTCRFGAAMGTITLVTIIMLLGVVIASGFLDETGLWMKIVAPIIGFIGLLWLILPWAFGNNPLGARAFLGALGLIGLCIWISFETYHIFPA